jgi:hypothetical protein
MWQRAATKQEGVSAGTTSSVETARDHHRNNNNEEQAHGLLGSSLC